MVHILSQINPLKTTASYVGRCPFTGCGWRRQLPDIEGSCEYIE
jgi:hypothetical protein